MCRLWSWSWLMLALLALPAHAQHPRCGAAPDTTADLLDVVAWYAGADDSSGVAARTSVGLPAARSLAELVPVTAGPLCERAWRAYWTAVLGDTTLSPGRVYVVRVHGAYVVWSPWFHRRPDDEHWVYLVFDARWKKTGEF